MIRKFCLITFALLGLASNGVATAALYNYSSVVTLCTGTCESFASLSLGSTITGTIEINTTPGGSFGDADIGDFQFLVFNPALPVSGPVGDPVNDNPLVVDSSLGIAASNGTSGTTDAANEINGGQMLIEFLVPPLSSNGAFIVFDLSTGNGQICLFFATAGCIPNATEAVKFEGQFSCVGGPGDPDCDSIVDPDDNCPLLFNPLQENNDGDAEGDVCDPDDDNDGIGDALDTQPLIASNNCTTNDGTNATLVSAQVMDNQTCASKESVDVNGDNGALDTVVFGPNGYLRLISKKVIFKDMNVEDGGRMEVINADPCPSCPVYYAVGDTGPSGGIVFYVTDGGLHGLEAAPVDQSTGVEWGCTGTDIVGADGTDVGTGAQNTIDILNPSGGCTDIGTPARLTDDYAFNGFDDWFLPSKDELNEMYVQLHLANLGDFDAVSYWSSSEVFGNDAWQQVFSVGVQSSENKVNQYRVRAIREF